MRASLLAPRRVPRSRAATAWTLARLNQPTHEDLLVGTDRVRRPGRRRRAPGAAASSSSVRSLRLAGSASTALATTIARPRALREGAHLRGRSGRPRRRGRQPGALDLLDQARRPRDRRAVAHARAVRSVHGEVVVEASSRPARGPRRAAAAAPRRAASALASRMLGPRAAGPLIACSLVRGVRCAAATVGVPERRAHSEPSGPPGSHSARNSDERAGAAEGGAARCEACAGQPSQHAARARRRAPRSRHSEAQRPAASAALDVAAGAEAVQQRDRPARVGQPVDRAPAGEADAAGAAGS